VHLRALFHLEIWNKLLSFGLEISKQQYHGKRTRPKERGQEDRNENS